MKQIIILRHSEAIGDQISETGKLKTKKLVGKFFSELEHSSAVIISAPSQRARDTASVVSEIVRGKIIVENGLAQQGYGTLGRDNWDRIEKLVLKQAADLVFAVMHRYETNEIVNIFCKKFSILVPEKLKDSENRLRTLNFDDAYVLNIEARDLRYIYLGKAKVFVD